MVPLRLSHKLIIHAGIGLPFLLMLVFSCLWTPIELESKDGLAKTAPVCLHRTITGRPCVGCGMTRGFAACAHGDFELARSYNRFAPLLFIGVSIIVVLTGGSAVCQIQRHCNKSFDRDGDDGINIA